MKTKLLILVALIAVGSVGAFYLRGTAQDNAPANFVENEPDKPGPAASLDDLAAQLNRLEQKLEQETIARQTLEVAVAQLKEKSGDAHSMRDDRSVKPDDEPKPSSRNTERVAQEMQSQQALQSLGLTPQRIQQIEKRNSDAELQELYLRDKAVREGWFGTERYANERRKLNVKTDAYRQELGDESYDRYLYLTGQTNRISVQHVIANSPADKAGVQTGDLIVSYDGRRVFSWGELTSATSDGELGATVRMQVKRGNRNLDFYVPRGPLGVRLDMMSLDPG